MSALPPDVRKWLRPSGERPLYIGAAPRTKGIAPKLLSLFAAWRSRRLTSGGKAITVEQERNAGITPVSTSTEGRHARPKLMEALMDDLEHLRAPVEVSLGTGVRKITELLELRLENVNFSGLSIFRPANGRDVEVRPNWFLLVDTKGKGPRHRVMPVNNQYGRRYLKSFRIELAGAYLIMPHTGVSENTLRSGFRKACKRAVYRLVRTSKAV